MALLGTEESGHYRELETRMNARTVHQKKMAVVEMCPVAEVRL